jgi:hypothetical protein
MTTDQRKHLADKNQNRIETHSKMTLLASGLRPSGGTKKGKRANKKRQKKQDAAAAEQAEQAAHVRTVPTNEDVEQMQTKMQTNEAKQPVQARNGKCRSVAERALQRMLLDKDSRSAHAEFWFSGHSHSQKKQTGAAVWSFTKPATSVDSPRVWIRDGALKSAVGEKYNGAFGRLASKQPKSGERVAVILEDKELQGANTLSVLATNLMWEAEKGDATEETKVSSVSDYQEEAGHETTWQGEGKSKSDHAPPTTWRYQSQWETRVRPALLKALLTDNLNRPQKKWLPTALLMKFHLSEKVEPVARFFFFAGVLDAVFNSSEGEHVRSTINDVGGAQERREWALRLRPMWEQELVKKLSGSGARLNGEHNGRLDNNSAEDRLTKYTQARPKLIDAFADAAASDFLLSGMLLLPNGHSAPDLEFEDVARRILDSQRDDVVTHSFGPLPVAGDPVAQKLLYCGEQSVSGGLSSAVGLRRLTDTLLEKLRTDTNGGAAATALRNELPLLFESGRRQMQWLLGDPCDAEGRKVEASPDFPPNDLMTQLWRGKSEGSSEKKSRDSEGGRTDRDLSLTHGDVGIGPASWTFLNEACSLESGVRAMFEVEKYSTAGEGASVRKVMREYLLNGSEYADYRKSVAKERKSKKSKQRGQKGEDDQRFVEAIMADAALIADHMRAGIRPRVGVTKEGAQAVREGATVHILYSYCTHTVLILYSCCNQAVLKLYSYCTHTVHSYCTHTVLILYSYCTHVVIRLYSYCPHTVLILSSYCTLILYSYCTRTALILYSYCTHP